LHLLGPDRENKNQKQGEEMKTNRQNNNEETKNQKPFLRRKTMKATRLTLIGLAAIAVIFSGCSKDSRITAPGSEAILDIDKNQSELTAQAETENDAARMAVRNDGLTQEHLSIVAEVNRTEVEGGCFYLTAESGENYTPLTPKSLSLELGMVLAANGYIDKDIHFFCGNGPAFVIEEYKILKKAESATEDRAEQKASDEKAAATSAQDAASKKKADEKRAISASDAAVKAPATLAENRFHQSSANIRDGKGLTESNVSVWPTEDRAPAETEDRALAQTEDRAPAETEDRAPAETEDRAPAETEDRALAQTEDRAPAETEDRAPAETEDRAPAQTEDRAPAESNEEEKAPGKIKERYLQLWTGADNAPAASEDRAPAESYFEEDNAPGKVKEEYAYNPPAEDRAPQQQEDNESAAEMGIPLPKPVPIIFDDTELSADDGVNTLEGYTHHAKGGCLMLTTDNKEVFELQHDMDYDVLLQDGTYIRVTGYISTLPYMTCEEATVFHAETIRILWGPKEKEEQPVNEQDIDTNESDDELEYIEEEGVMHRTEPEGMCWYFETASGHRYELIFSSAVSLRSGMQLKVKGLPARVDTFCGSGKPLQVVRWESINENKF
jgi:hypothetical protein